MIFSRKSVYRTPTGFNIFLSLAFFVVVFRLGIILWWSWSIFRERRKRVGRSCVGDTRSRRGPPDSLVQWGRSISRMIIFDHFYPNQSSRTNRTSTIGHEYEMVTWLIHVVAEVGKATGHVRPIAEGQNSKTTLKT